MATASPRRGSCCHGSYAAIGVVLQSMAASGGTCCHNTSLRTARSWHSVPVESSRTCSSRLRLNGERATLQVSARGRHLSLSATTKDSESQQARFARSIPTSISDPCYRWSSLGAPECAKRIPPDAGHIAWQPGVLTAGRMCSTWWSVRPGRLPPRPQHEGCGSDGRTAP